MLIRGIRVIRGSKSKSKSKRARNAPPLPYLTFTTRIAPEAPAIIMR